MVDEKLFADLVELYRENVKTYIEQNTGLIVQDVRPLLIEDVEKVFDPKEHIDYTYIKNNYRNFTINPQVTEMKVNHDGVTYVEISPDISWEKQVCNGD